MKWAIYNVIFFVAYLVLVPAFLLRMWRRGGYRARFADRFGRYPTEVLDRIRRGGVQRPVWIHAVSVGEVQVAGQLMRALREIDDSIWFVFSTTSSTGWRTAEKVVGADDVLIYNPLDFPPFVRRAFNAVRPRMVILTETEIWPNFIRETKKRGLPLLLANARISDRSAPRYRKARFFLGERFRAFDRISAQSDLDRDRLVAAGADPAAIEVTGSFKFDVAVRNEAKERELREWIGDGEILLGGSTWPGEDSVLLDVYRRLVETRPGVKLVIAPRHFEKADAVETNILAAGFACRRRSRDVKASSAEPRAADGEPRTTVYLADTTGELMGLFGIATVAFVGKSLCAHGSQNMIEPCLCGVPTIVGPYTENFRSVVSDLLASAAIIQVQDAAALEREVLRLFGDDGARADLGARAVAAVASRRGATAKFAGDVFKVLSK